MEELLNQLSLSERDYKVIRTFLHGGEITNKEKLKEVALIITKHAVLNGEFGKPAAKLCLTISEEEKKLENESRFRNALLTQLQAEYRILLSAEGGESEEKWIGFVTFLCSVFYHIRIKGEPMKALVVPVLECLSLLAQQRNANKEKIIQCLVMQLQMHGEELDRANHVKMAELFHRVRDLFLCERTSQLSRLMLLEVIELRAGDWKLSPAAFKYYYADDAS